MYLLERVPPPFGDALHFGVMCFADNCHRRICAFRFRVRMLLGLSLRQLTCCWGYIQGSYVTRVYTYVYTAYTGAKKQSAGNRGDQVVIGVGVVSDWLRE